MYAIYIDKILWLPWPLTCFFLLRSSNHSSQHFCDVCKCKFKMDWGNAHNNWWSNWVFTVYAYCHHCSTVHKVPHRLGGTMMCLSNYLLSNTSHHSFAHPTGVNNESTIFQGDDDMHDNDDSPTRKVVDNDSNCLSDTSDSNESSSFLKGTCTHGDSKVFFNGLSWMDISSITIHPRTRLGLYLIIHMISMSLINSRYHHHANWTWIHMSLCSCCL